MRLVGYTFSNYHKIYGSTKYRLTYNTSYPFDLKYDNSMYGYRLFLFENDNKFIKEQFHFSTNKIEHILKTCHKKELKEKLKLRQRGIKL